MIFIFQNIFTPAEYFSFHISHTDDHESRIISQAGKWANRHFVIFSLIERPHLSSKPLFSSPISCNALMQNRSWVDDWCNLFPNTTTSPSDDIVSEHHHYHYHCHHDHHHHHLMTLVSERGHSFTHRSSDGSKKVDEDLARVRLRRWV